MDESIRAATPEYFRACGARAFDEGLGVDDHDMNPGSLAIADWRKGWLERRAAVHAVVLVKHFASVGSPP